MRIATTMRAVFLGLGALSLGACCATSRTSARAVVGGVPDEHQAPGLAVPGQEASNSEPGAYRGPFVLTPSPPEYYALFGDTLAVHGDLLAVRSGNPYRVVRVYRRLQECDWQEIGHIPPPSGAQHFGSYLVLTDTHLIVAASSSAYVYAVDDWHLMQELPTQGRIAAMDANADQIVVSVQPSPGAVLVWARRSEGWSLSQRIDAPQGTPAASFGNGLALRGDVLMVGAPDYSGQQHRQGALCAYALRQGRWELTQILTASDGGRDHLMGSSVALADGVAAVTAGHGLGLVYVFVSDTGGRWREVAKLSPRDVPPPMYFESVTMPDAHTLVLSTSSQGSWVFQRVQSEQWRETQSLAKTDAGWRAFSSGNILAIPSANSTVDATQLAGSVYVFER